MISDLFIPEVTNHDKCAFCAACEKACPEKAISIENSTFRLNREKCLSRKIEFCTICADICQRKILRMITA